MAVTRGLVMIVKNEATRLPACLESAAAAGVSVATIVDTGSTDGTPDLAVTACAGLGIEFAIHIRPWVNFGHNRSEAFALARGSADWLLALDADMTAQWDEGWEPDPGVDAYMIEMHTGDVDYRLPLLLRGDLPWVSKGAVHEYTLLEDGSIGRREPTDHVRVSYVHDSGSSEKTAWHASLLEADLAKDPDNERTTFYLAQTYREMGRMDDARELYRRRAGMGGWDEEAWYARYRAALLEPSWPDRFAGLIAAWESRPARLEPLHDAVAELNARKQHRAAYSLSDVPAAPTADILFVRRDVYDWGMLFERSLAAWWVGARDEFRALAAQLLRQQLPAHVRAALERNLAA